MKSLQGWKALSRRRGAVSEWHSIPAQFHSFILVVFVFCCSLVSVVLCGLLFIIQDLPQRVGFSVTLMLYSRFLIAR